MRPTLPSRLLVMLSVGACVNRQTVRVAYTADYLFFRSTQP
jgi:hypothetical protein